jgi:pimeloyl-ACP methyl ester carboxylesterase
MIAVFFITLAIGQLMSAYRCLHGASLTGRFRLAGFLAGILLLIVGILRLPADWTVLWWTPLAAIAALSLLFVAGSWVAPIPPPEMIFSATHPAHGGCQRVAIPDGNFLAPGLLIKPPVTSEYNGAAVCIIHGAGDNKTMFKWRLVQALLAEHITVLTVDLPGHGDYRHRPLTYPDGASTVRAAVRFLRQQPDIRSVGLIGLSLGGAFATNLLAQEPYLVDGLVVIATPGQLRYDKKLLYQVMWNTYYRSPVVDLLREITVRQARRAWKSGGYRSPLNTSQWFDLLKPLECIQLLKTLPILLVYSQRDAIASRHDAQAMRMAVPRADYLEAAPASHVMVTLMPAVNRSLARWLKQTLLG